MDLLNAMKSFVRVAQVGSFSGAARELGINQGSLSRIVKKLEAELGVQLLHRTTRKLRLTEPGHAFLSESARLLAEIEALSERTKDLQGAPRGHLRIGLPLAFGRMFVVPRMAKFKRLHPEISLELVLEDRYVDVVEGGYDIVVRIGALASSTHLARKLATVQRYLVCSPRVLGRKVVLNEVEDLAELPALVFESSRSASARLTLSRSRRTRAIQIRSHTSVNHLESIRQMALDGLGVAHLPSWLVQADIESGALLRLFPDWKIESNVRSESAVYALYPATKQQTAKVRAYIDFLVAEISVGAGF